MSVTLGVLKTIALISERAAAPWTSVVDVALAVDAPAAVLSSVRRWTSLLPAWAAVAVLTLPSAVKKTL